MSRPSNNSERGAGAIHSEWVDWLRGLAALAVVIYHVRVDLWVGWNALRSAPGDYTTLDHAASLLSIPAPFFGSGVLLFFVISGFCIHIAFPIDRQLNWKGYGVRRFLRIYPPYLAVVVACLVLEHFLSARGAQTSADPALAFSTVLMAQNSFWWPAQIASNPSLWSLPVEMELYLAYPLARWVLQRHGERVLMAVGLAVSVCSWGGGFVGWPSLGGHFTHFWAIWILGMLAAHRVHLGTVPKVGAAGLALGVVLLGAASIAELRQWKFIPLALVFGAGFSILLAWGLNRPPSFRLVPPPLARSLTALGMISYSLYLIHFPLFKLLGTLWLNVYGTKPANFLVSLIAVALSVALAALFYRWVEGPSHVLSRRAGQAVSRRSGP